MSKKYCKELEFHKTALGQKMCTLSGYKSMEKGLEVLESLIEECKTWKSSVN